MGLSCRAWEPNERSRFAKLDKEINALKQEKKKEVEGKNKKPKPIKEEREN